MKVYVVSWEYDGGGGFDWFYTAEDAAKALEVEKADSTWETVSAYAFDAESNDPEAVTAEIDRCDWTELHDANIVRGRLS